MRTPACQYLAQWKRSTASSEKCETHVGISTANQTLTGGAFVARNRIAGALSELDTRPISMLTLCLARR